MLYLNDDFDGGELFFTDRDAKTVTVSHLTFQTQVEHFTLADLHVNFDLCPTGPGHHYLAMLERMEAQLSNVCNSNLNPFSN